MASWGAVVIGALAGKFRRRLRRQSMSCRAESDSDGDPTLTHLWPLAFAR